LAACQVRGKSFAKPSIPADVAQHAVRTPSAGEQRAVKRHNGGITATTAFLIAIDKTAKVGTADLSAPAQRSFPLQQRFSEESCYFRQLAGVQ
jgi:hypothetical protein